jgi:hypothetical protein
MGIRTAVDEIQARMSDILGDLRFVKVYLDDIMIVPTVSFTVLHHQRNILSAPNGAAH